MEEIPQTADTQHAFQEHEPQPGIQYLEPSNLEVVQTRQGLSQNRTYEQPSLLPEFKPWGLSPQPPQAVPFSDLQAVPVSDLNAVPISDLNAVQINPLHRGRHPHPNSAQSVWSSEPDHKSKTKTKIKPPILGLKRKTFWILLSITIFFSVAAIAVGVGVGVARSQGSTTLQKANKTSTSSTSSSRNLPFGFATSTFHSVTSTSSLSSSTTPPSASASASSSTTPQPRLGCYNDTDTPRTLSDPVKYFNAANLTLSKCLSVCLDLSSSYAYAGVEYASECWCGNSSPSNNLKVPDSRCNLKCKGTDQTCGGAWAIEKKPPSPNTTLNLPLPTTTLPLPTDTGTAALAITCPQNNMTLYTTSTQQKNFLVLCDRDYPGDRGSKDIKSQSPVHSMEECLNICAATRQCTAVGWGIPWPGDSSTCFLKGSLGGVRVKPGWYFAVVQDAPG